MRVFREIGGTDAELTEADKLVKACCKRQYGLRAIACLACCHIQCT
jgi:hypothetical protein